RDPLVTGVQTCALPILVIATGIWAPLTGRLVGVPIPLVPMRHQYAITEPVPALAMETEPIRHPILRHQDRAMYFRQVGQRYGLEIGRASCREGGMAWGE